MEQIINRLPLQFFGKEDIEDTAEDTNDSEIDFGAVFGVETSKEELSEENDGESEPSKPSEEEKGVKSELAIQKPEDEIPNEVWKKARQKAEFEAQAKIRQAEEKFNNSFADDEYIGQKNPYTGKVIKTKQDQQEYLESYSKETLKNSGLDENIIQKMIDNNPVIQEAKRVTEQVNRERGESQLQKQIEIISKINPEIKTFEDFTKLPNRKEIDDYVINKGYTLADAYKIVNYEELVGRKTAVAKQQAINAVKGKSHLISTESNGGEEIIVPADVMKQYKLFNPNATTEDIKKHYAKAHKKE